MSAELGAVAAAAPVPLLTAQVRVVENEGESSNNFDARPVALRTKVITMLAPRPPHASPPPSRAALLPASAAYHFFLSMAVPRRDFFVQSPRRLLKSTKTNTTALMFPVKVRWL